MALLQAGWQWHPQPKPALCDELRDCTVGLRGVELPCHFFSDVQVCNEYLPCLLIASNLHTKGILDSLHGQPRNAYVGILNGNL